MKILPAILGFTITIILVGSTLAPIIADYSERASPEFGWVYDDFQECDPSTSVGGVFELVTYGSKTYIHATDVGEGTINGESYAVDKAPLGVFLLWGQSNAMYGYYDVTVANECPPCETNGYYFGSTVGPTVSYPNADRTALTNDPLSNAELRSMINPDGSFKIGNIEASFTSAYSDNNQNIRPYFVNASVAGCALQYFIPGALGNTNIHTIWDAAIDAIDLDKFEVQKQCWIMVQGESDGGWTTEQTYLSLFAQVYDDLKTTTDLDEGLIVRTRDTETFSTICQAQDAIVKTYPDIHMGCTATSSFTVENGLLRDDNLHYTQKGDNIIGEDCAETWMSLTDPAPMASLSILKLIPLLLILAGVAGIIAVVANPRD